MNINEAFPSNYLKHSDLQGRSVRLQIARIEREKLGDDWRPIVYFQRTDKGFSLNKTNAMRIAKAYGAETNGWIGHHVELYPDVTQYLGEEVDCIRVRPIAPPGQQAALGGNGQQTQQQPAQQQQQQAAQPNPAAETAPAAEDESQDPWDREAGDPGRSPNFPGDSSGQDDIPF